MRSDVLFEEAEEQIHLHLGRTHNSLTFPRRECGQNMFVRSGTEWPWRIELASPCLKIGLCMVSDVYSVSWRNLSELEQ